MVVFLRTIILYAFVVLVMRVMGKRQIGELQPFELVIALMLSELAAIPMQETGIPLLHGIIPIVTLMLLEIFISYLSLKLRPIRKIVCGTPSILVKNGKIIESEMRRLRFNIDDLLEDLRIAGYLDIGDLEYVIMENSGKLSVIPKSEKSPLTKEDMQLKTSKTTIPVGLVYDGELLMKNIKEAGYNEEWFYKKMKENGVSKIEEIFFAVLDSNGKLFIQKR